MIHIQDFHRRFRTQDQCLQYLFKLRYPASQCPKCHRKNAYHRHPTKLCFTCNCGRSHIFPCKGTIFGNSPLPLTKWFYAIYLLCTERDGISVKELERRIDTTYPTAWRMAKKIRRVLPKDPVWRESVTIDTFLLPFIGDTKDTQTIRAPVPVYLEHIDVQQQEKNLL